MEEKLQQKQALVGVSGERRGETAAGGTKEEKQLPPDIKTH